jgi:hypothetical protein
MGKKAKVPQAPDYTALAQQQAQQGQESWNAALQAGRPNQSNPFGSLTWSQDPTTGQWSQNVALNQPQQDIFNQQQANQQQIANMGGNMLGGFNQSQVDLSKAPQLPSGPADYSSLGKIPGAADYGKGPAMPGVADYSSLGKVPGAVDYSSLGEIPKVGQYNQQATDLFNQLAQPQLDRQRAAREAQMAAMGMSLGSGRAYDTQQELLNDSENRSAMMGAQAGIQQGNVMFNQGMQGYQQGAQNLNNQFAQNMQGYQQGAQNLNNQFTQGLGLRQQGVQEANNQWQQNMAGYQQGAQNLNNQFTQGMGLNQQGVANILAERNANMQQLQGLMGLGQQMGTPQFSTVQTPNPYQTPNLMGAAGQQYQAAVSAANAQNANRGGLMGGLMGMAGTALGGPIGGAIGSGIGGLFGGSGGGVQNSYPNTYAASMGQLYGPPQS